MNENFGKPVSWRRLDSAETCLKEMCPDMGTLSRMMMLGFFRERIERDEPAVLVSADPPKQITGLDLTGRYRLLATMLSE